MSVHIDRSSEDGMRKIRIVGRFDFNLHKAFRESYSDTAPNKVKIVIDLAETQYMDSSALGMLLLLREHAGEDDAVIRIVNCNPEIQKILEIANFHELFKIN